MKKIALLLALCLSVSAIFCGCGDEKTTDETQDAAVAEKAENDGGQSADSVSVVGEWTVSQMIDADKKSYTLEEYCESKGLEQTAVECTYTFKEDGSLIAAINGAGVEGSYQLDGSTLTITVGENTMAMTYNTEKDTLEYTDAASGLTTVFSKK